MIGLSSTYYAVRGLSINDSVRKIAELGFELIELGAAHAFEDDVWETLKRLRRDLPGIKFTVHGLFPPLKEMVWFNAADGLIKVNREIIDDLFKTADILRSPLVTFHAPIANKVEFRGNKVPGGFYGASAGEAKDQQLSWQRFNELLEYLDNKARQAGIMVGIENLDLVEFNAMLFSAQKFSEIFGQFSRIGLLFDVGHAILCDQLAEYCELKERIVEVHLHDIRELPDKGKWGHFVVEDEAYFEPLSDILVEDNVPFIFEHGVDVSEREILAEKKLLEGFISKHKAKVAL